MRPLTTILATALLLAGCSRQEIPTEESLRQIVDSFRVDLRDQLTQGGSTDVTVSIERLSIKETGDLLNPYAGTVDLLIAYTDDGQKQTTQRTIAYEWVASSKQWSLRTVPGVM